MSLQNWVATITILSLIVTALYQVIRVVIQIYAVLEQIKQSGYVSDQELDERIDNLSYDVTGLKKDVRDIRGVIKRFLPESFRRTSDYEADRQEDSNP